MKTHIYNIRDIDEYWERLDKELDLLIRHMLRERYEYGTNEMCSEAGIQQSLVHYASKIAKNQENRGKSASLLLEIPDFS